MGIHELSATLWRERAALELLLRGLAQATVRLSSGDPGEARASGDEVRASIDDLKSMTLLRIVDTAATADEWGAPERCPLAELEVYAPSGPWSAILAAHREAIDDLARENVRLQDHIRHPVEDAGLEPLAPCWPAWATTGTAPAG